MDENKENQTPEGVQQQGELDWVQQYSLDQEREEQELQQALAQSLQEHVSLKPCDIYFNPYKLNTHLKSKGVLRHVETIILRSEGFLENLTQT